MVLEGFSNRSPRTIRCELRQLALQNGRVLTNSATTFQTGFAIAASAINRAASS
jgi:hypothetical protein